MTARQVLIGLIVLAIAAFGLKMRHDGAAAMKPKLEAATDAGVTANLETEGARSAASWAAEAAQQRQAVAATLSTLQSAALAAGDANAPLPADRADRLHAADRGLCDARPGLIGCVPSD